MTRALLVRGGHLHTAVPGAGRAGRACVLCVGGVIVAIGDDRAVTARLSEEDSATRRDLVEVDATRMLVLPGLVNAHWHASLGSAPAAGHPDLNLWGERPDPWDDRADRPGLMAGDGAVAQVSARFAPGALPPDDTPPEEAEAIARYAVWTQVRCGITTVADAGAVGFETVSRALPKALEALGVRGAVTIDATDGRCTADGRFERTAETRDVLDRVDTALHGPVPSGGDRVRRLLGAGYALSMSTDLGRQLAERGARHRLPFLTHVACFPGEAALCTKAFGSTPIARLADLGLVNDRLIAVHCGFATPAERDLLIGNNAHINYSPAKYGQSGESPVTKGTVFDALLRPGGRISLSTDGLALPVGGMIETMQQAWQLHNQLAGDNTALRPSRVLQMATLEGARALHWESHIGSIEVGKGADLVLLPIDDWRYLLRPRPLDGLLLLGASNDVHTVIVDGHVVLEHGKSTRVDEVALRDQYLRACRAVAARRWGSGASGSAWLDDIFGT